MSIPQLLQYLSSLSIPLEDSASEETIWDLAVTTIPSLLYTLDLGLFEGMEESFGYHSSSTISILPCAPSGSDSDNSKQLKLRCTRKWKLGLLFCIA